MDRMKKHAEAGRKEQKNLNGEAGRVDAETPEPVQAAGAKSDDTASGDKKKGVENERRREERRKRDRRADCDDNESKLVHSLRDEIKKRDDEIEKLTAELESAKDTMLRRQADFENYKKRVAKSQADQRKFTIRDFALDIIDINDDLLRAIEASDNMTSNNVCDDAHTSFVDGVSMISKRIEDTLKKYGIEEVDSQGREFDPNFNEAVEIEMSDDVDVDTVTQVYQKGFHIDDVVVRSARVKVAKPMKQSGGEGGADESRADQDSGESGS